MLGIVTTWRTWVKKSLSTGRAPRPGFPNGWAALSVSAKTASSEMVLTAPEYLDGRLDWFWVSRPVQAMVWAPPKTAPPLTESVSTAPVSFRGMPSALVARNSKTAPVNFAERPGRATGFRPPAAREVRPGIQQRWFLLPSNLPSAPLTDPRARRHQLHVWRTLPHPARQQGGWTGLATLARIQPHERCPEIVFPAAGVGPMLESQTGRRPVVAADDEMANVAVAVERVVRRAAGRPMDRPSAYHETLAAQPLPPLAMTAIRWSTGSGRGAGLLDSVAGQRAPPRSSNAACFRHSGEGGIQSLPQLPEKRRRLPDEPHRGCCQQGKCTSQKELASREAINYARWIDWARPTSGIGRRKDPVRYPSSKAGAGSSFYMPQAQATTKSIAQRKDLVIDFTDPPY